MAALRSGVMYIEKGASKIVRMIEAPVVVGDYQVQQKQSQVNTGEIVWVKSVE